MAPEGMAALGAPGPEYYDQVYFEREMYSSHYKKSPEVPIWEWIAERLVSIDDVAVLEIGCGTGQFAHFLWDRGYRDYHGVDFSPTAIEKSRKRVPDVRFSLGDIRKPQWYRGHHNVVVAVEVLEHLDDDLAVLRMLRPGDHLFYSVPNMDSKGHVRFFSDLQEATSRYMDFIERGTSTKIGSWFVGYGVVGARP